MQRSIEASMHVYGATITVVSFYAAKLSMTRLLQQFQRAKINIFHALQLYISSFQLL